MWYLKYMYTDQKTGNAVKRSALLETDVYYTIGQSEDSSFVISSPKVAATHLRLLIDAKDYPHASPHLKLQIIGPSAVINGEPIDLTQLSETQRLKQEFTDHYKTIDARIGKLGIKIKIYNRLVLIKPGKDGHLQVNELKKMGIVYDKAISNKTTHVISEPSNYSNHVLDALIRQIPIVPETYIQEIINRKYLLVQNFEQNYPKVEDYLFDQSFRALPSRKSIFNGIVFIFSKKKQCDALKDILKDAGAAILLYDYPPDPSVDKLVQFIKENVQQNQKYLLVKLQSSQNEDFLTSVYNPDGQEYQHLKLLNEAAKVLGIYLTTNEDIFNAVKEITVDNLFRKRLEKSNSPFPIKTSDQPPQKKAKRGRFKQLDSLDFFIGGGKKEANDSPKAGSPVLESQTTNSSEHQVKDTDLNESIREPPKKKQRSRFKAIPNMMLDLDHSFAEVGNDIQQLPTKEQNSVAGIAQLEELPNNNKKPTKVADSAIPLEQEAFDLKIPENDNIKETLKSQETQSFTSALLETKKLTDDRIKKELGIEEDFDTNTVIRLQDLAIVESFEIKPRSKQIKPSSQPEDSRLRTNKNHWEGRKNFKTFVKNSSKSQKNKNFNHSFREFITFKDYDPSTDDKVSAQTEEMLNHIEKQRKIGHFVRNEENIEAFSFRKKELVIANNDIRQPTTIDNQHNGLFIQTDTDSEDDQGFKFTDGDGYTMRDGLGMNVRLTEVGEVPEFRKHFEEEPTKIDKQTAKLGTSGRQYNLSQQYNENKEEESDDAEEDDDYDSDTPRFRFRN